MVGRSPTWLGEKFEKNMSRSLGRYTFGVYSTDINSQKTKQYASSKSVPIPIEFFSVAMGT